MTHHNDRPAAGGTAPFTSAAKDARTLVATGHSDGQVRLWNLTPSGHLDLLCLVTPPTIAGVAAGSMVLSVDLCRETGQLCVGYSDGTVVVFTFATTGREVAPKILEGSMVVPPVPSIASPAAPAVDPNMITPKKIGQITQMGFTPEQAEKALATSGGDVNIATANLFSEDIDDAEGAGSSGEGLGGGAGGAAATAAAAANPRDRPSFSLGGGDALVEESVADDTPQKRSPTSKARASVATSYKARAGYQCELVATCTTQYHAAAAAGSGSGGGGGGAGPRQQVTALKLCAAWGAMAFGTEGGVCIVTGVLSGAPQIRAYSVSQLLGLKAAKFRVGLPSLVQLQPCEEAATVVAFGPADIGGAPARALWLGTSTGATYAK